MTKEKKPFDPAMDATFAEIDPEAWRSPVPLRRPDNQRAVRPYKGRRRKR